MMLQPHHIEQLRASGLSDAIIAERGYCSVSHPQELALQGFAESQCRVPGLLIPVWTPDGAPEFCLYRPDNPREDRRGRLRKYEMPKGTGARLDVPPRCQAMLRNPREDLWITEGIKKADALAQHGLCAVALLGVWMFKGTNKLGGVAFLADWDHIALNGRTVYIVFDSDIMDKPSVKDALRRLTELLRRKRARVRPVYLPPLPDGGKCGVDDFLLTNSVEQLRKLAQTQPSQTQSPQRAPAMPSMEVLETAPAMLTRPLQLVGQHAYATTWLYVRKTITESRGKNGNIIVHNPPKIETQRMLVVVRDDGSLYGLEQPLDDLGFDIQLNDASVPDNRLWSARGVQRYVAGERPDVADVFKRVAKVFDHYLDFSRSIGSQEQMCYLSACLTIATYLTDAYTVQGYPWPNGERGCGKTKWASLWATMSYLGMLITAGGSFAALRDLAEYGAALAFDDAENLNDPKHVDPNKRALLLAGNRKGVQIPLKEQQGDTWVTRWVNAYAPRAFTAINCPDDVLFSRSIIIPLVRTGDATRANRDPAKINRWPCDAQQLIDDLWALGLWLLPEATKVWDELDHELETLGRELDPWRASLATARLLERHGVDGVEKDIRTVMQNYVDERGESIAGDRQRATALAIVRYAEERLRDNGDLREVAFTASDIVNVLHQLADAESEEEEEADCSWASVQAVGWQLSRLRLPSRRTSGGGRRERILSVSEIEALARAFGIPTFLPHEGDGDA